MLGVLNETQIDALLSGQVTGRLGCAIDGKVYIVPINYYYKNSTIYSHSAAGKKIDMMRQNPNVCFQVDQISSIFQWQSAILWGRFEEITDKEKKHQAMQGLTHRLMPFVTTPAGHPSHGITSNEADLEDLELIIYKITITEKSGKFEYSDGI
ncbi:MAG: Pyridoxamine 5-phosphate oxidase [Pedobacter sp.]|jgi:nitroimidazol reductase NimA-like FMN-containing flavoprotein (pyridoxamine 5'-phosphate oxidase superfamily)|nr:Pyridoxamine 5-phosphate oxidase [Pedobacter sp.]